MTREPVYYTVKEPLTVREAVDQMRANGFDIGPDAVRRWCRDERVPALKLLNGEWYIPAAAIKAVIHGKDPHRAVAAQRHADSLAATELEQQGLVA